jgi:hypothetical protein
MQSQALTLVYHVPSKGVFAGALGVLTKALHKRGRRVREDDMRLEAEPE